MNKSLISLAAGAVVGLAAFSSAYAGNVFLNNGIDFGANGSTSTSSIASLGYTQTLATSIYLGDPAVIGTTVVDTNETTTMGAFGLGAPGTRTTVGGSSVDFAFPFDPDQLNINSIGGPPFPVDGNGFADGESTPYGAGRWGLTYRYTLLGQTTGPGLTSTSVSFTSGYFDVFYRDGTGAGNDGKQLLRLDVTGSLSNNNNLAIFGIASFDFDSSGPSGNDDTGGDTFVQNFFRDAYSGVSYYDAYMNSGGTAVQWNLATNVDPPVPSINDLWQVGGTGSGGPLVRQSTLNGTIKFAVPEPGSLALLGVALAGLGFVQRRKIRGAK